jgi:transposase
MLTQRNKLNFEGQSIYVGIDVHLNSWNVTILTANNTHKTYSADPSPEQLGKYLNDHFPNANYFSAYEAGFCGVWIHNRLEALGITNIIVNPGDVPTMDKERREKRDAVDSKKIARALRGDELTGIYVHDALTLHDRALLRYRAKLMKKLNATRHQIKADLYLGGVEYPGDLKDSKKHWGRRFLRWLRDEVAVCGKVNRFVFVNRLEEFDQQRDRLLSVTREVRRVANSEAYKARMDLLRSVPGIGLIVGMTLLVNIGDITRFADTCHFVGYIGLKPTCHSSGEKDVQGGITPRCQSLLRSMLIESAWIAARIDPSLALAFNSLCSRMNKNKAIVRIARKLANRIYSVLVHKQEYSVGMA